MVARLYLVEIPARDLKRGMNWWDADAGRTYTVASVFRSPGSTIVRFRDDERRSEYMRHNEVAQHEVMA